MYMNFQLHMERGLASLTPELFKGQVYFLGSWADGEVWMLDVTVFEGLNVSSTVWGKRESWGI